MKHTELNIVNSLLEAWHVTVVPCTHLLANGVGDHGFQNLAASLEDLTHRPCPNFDNICMLKKHNKLGTDDFPTRKPPLPRRASIVIHLHVCAHYLF